MEDFVDLVSSSSSGNSSNAPSPSPPPSLASSESPQVSSLESSGDDGDAGGSQQVGGKRKRKRKTKAAPQGLPLLRSPAATVPFDATNFDAEAYAGENDSPGTTTEKFHTNDYGKRTALYDPSAWKIRLLGRLRLDFEFAPGVGDTAAARKKQWRRLIKPVRETNISTRLYAKGSYKEVHGQKTWNKDGEPGSDGEPVLTMKRLYDLLLEEVLLCGNFDMEKAVHALMSLSKPVKKVYDAPMVRTVCRTQKKTWKKPRRAPAKKASKNAQQNSAGATEMLDYDDPFSLGGLLRAQENTGYRDVLLRDHVSTELPSPASLLPQDTVFPGLSLKMKDYQRQSVAWMIDMERTNLNALFWERWEWADGGAPFYYMPCAGELRLEEPPFTRGGLLCEEMGLGKTLEIISLILWSKINEPVGTIDNTKKSGWVTPDEAVKSGSSTWYDALSSLETNPSGATLIVVPSTLLGQWAAEIRKSVPSPCVLSLFVLSDKSQTEREILPAAPAHVLS
eukprot:g4340.t1